MLFYFANTSHTFTSSLFSDLTLGSGSSETSTNEQKKNVAEDPEKSEDKIKSGKLGKQFLC